MAFYALKDQQTWRYAGTPNGADTKDQAIGNFERQLRFKLTETAANGDYLLLAFDDEADGDQPIPVHLLRGDALPER